MEQESAGGLIMLVAAAVALVWANSPLWESYARLWGTEISFQLGDLLHLEHTLQEWINDALMVIFFFLVAMEIKRELVFGELRDPRKAAMPVIAAAGGMVVPAALFLAFNAGGDASGGWGIPIATDIAFAVAVVTLAGPRFPPAAKLFLLTLAIADDLGGILVIAAFYTDDLSFGWLAAALVGLVVIAVLARIDVRYLGPYLVLGVFVWLAFLESGVHATLAGVCIGLLTPTRAFLAPAQFAAATVPLVHRVQESLADQIVTTEEEVLNAHYVGELVQSARESLSPMDRISHAIEPWVAFVIVPVFALANAGVRVVGGESTFDTSLMVGVFLGLLVGKPVGVLAASWLAVKLRVGTLPTGTGWLHMVGVGICAGVGFTVALFITELSFGAPDLVDSAKVGVLGASLLAGIAGFLVVRASGGPRAAGDGSAAAAEREAVPAEAVASGQGPSA